jgi:hypothetical protein
MSAGGSVSVKARNKREGGPDELTFYANIETRLYEIGFAGELDDLVCWSWRVCVGHREKETRRGGRQGERCLGA